MKSYFCEWDIDRCKWMEPHRNRRKGLGRLVGKADCLPIPNSDDASKCVKLKIEQWQMWKNDEIQQIK